MDTCQHLETWKRLREYLKLNELMKLQIGNGATQLMTFDLSTLGTRFDVILLEPSLEEYWRRASGVTLTWSPWEEEEIMNIKLEDVGAQGSFVFLWCGSCEGLDLGRECLKKWAKEEGGSKRGEGKRRLLAFTKHMLVMVVVPTTIIIIVVDTTIITNRQIHLTMVWEW